MEKFLEELRKALTEAKVEKIEEIVSEYEEHFLVGHEAGMTDEEIIERFGTIDEIVESYKNLQENNEMNYYLSLNLEIFDEFSIERTDANEIHLVADEEVFNYITVEKGMRSFRLKLKEERRFHTIKPKYSGTLYIGKQMVFDQVAINNVSSDLKICSLKGKKLLIQNVSGDAELEDMDFSENVKISSVSGDVDAKSITAPNVVISTVSGDFEIDEICCDDASLKDVNGDIRIGIMNEANVTLASVNGDIRIDSGNPNIVSQSSLNGAIYLDGKCISEKISKVMGSLKKKFEDWKW